MAINKNEFEQLCGLQCDAEEITVFLGVSHEELADWVKKTYEKDFSEVFGQKRLIGRIKLKKALFRLAEQNGRVSVFLAQNLLGQTGNENWECRDNDL